MLVILKFIQLTQQSWRLRTDTCLPVRNFHDHDSDSGQHIKSLSKIVDQTEKLGLQSTNKQGIASFSLSVRRIQTSSCQISQGQAIIIDKISKF